MSTEEFKSARDFLLAVSENYDFARAGFKWPRPERFNWALDWFDAELAKGEHGARPALKILGDGVETLGFAELSAISSRLANGLRGLGARRGDRMLLMLGNVAPLWVAMLAAMKLGLVVIPATTLLTGADIADRLARGRARFVIADGADAAKFAGQGEDFVRIAVGGAPAGWLDYASLLKASAHFEPDGPNSSRRSDAALFHLGHDCAAQARHAQSCELPDRAPLDHVRPGVEARRSASQHFLARLGQARLVELLRALERGRLHRRARQAVRAARDARRSRRARDHFVLCAADRLAPADSARPRGLESERARSQLGGRTAQSGSDRTGRPRLGRVLTRFLRPDRDDDDDRQCGRPAGRRGLDGTSAARLSRRAARRRRARAPIMARSRSRSRPGRWD